MTLDAAYLLTGLAGFLIGVIPAIAILGGEKATATRKLSAFLALAYCIAATWGLALIFGLL